MSEGGRGGGAPPPVVSVFSRASAAIDAPRTRPQLVVLVLDHVLWPYSVRGPRSRVSLVETP